jgi:organic hydroperoxide reductase OsmC/OhrA
MSTHQATIHWNNPDPNFLKGQFSRAHTWTFDGGLSVPASASPAVVRPPLSDPAAIDPEEAFVASLSSCHMLTFLWLASRAGFIVESYHDHAVGTTTKNDVGTPWISTVILHPAIVYAGEKRPTPEEESHLHHLAHQQCFIAQSVKTTVTVEKPQDTPSVS